LDASTPNADIPAAEAQPIATVTERILASIIDGLLYVVISFVWRTFSADQTANVLFATAFWAVYQSLAIWRYGKTLGKHVMGIRVAVYDTPDRRPSLPAAVIRWCVLSMLPLQLAALAVDNDLFAVVVTLLSVSVVISVFVNSQNRGWHDKAAGTWVLRKPKPAKPADIPWLNS
jgi:uncharacterized RDD family membrane protein YckC